LRNDATFIKLIAPEADAGRIAASPH